MAPETWLTPYMDAWATYQGAVNPGRLAKAVKLAHEMLADQGPHAFLAFVQSGSNLKPEWFAPNCRAWAKKGVESDEPLVSDTGLLTERGRRAYTGGA